jgi:hypothetical protein
MLNDDRGLVYEAAKMNEFEIDVTEAYIEEDNDGCFMETTAYEKLFEYFADEMPYGVAKCRDGEPDVWILEELETCN